MNRNRTLRYVAPFLGALLFSASIGGVVIGGYAAVQDDLDLCGTPTVLVTSPSETKTATMNGTHTPSVPKLAYEELTPAEREAFEEALDSPLNEGDVHGPLEHESAFRRGVVVTYEGGEHYVLVGTMDECASVSPLLLPASVVGLLGSLVLFAASFLAGRRE